MRVWRWITFAMALVPVLAVAALAEPRALPATGAKSAKDDKDEKADPLDPGAQRAKAIGELKDLLREIDNRPPPKPVGPMVPPKGKPDYPPPDPATSIDRLREGMNQFRNNDFEAARRTFYYTEPTALGPADRAFAQYMLACSLRRLGKIAEAEAIYREVANGPDDEFLAACAVSQLGLIRSNQELETQLGLLRSRAKSK